MAYLEYLRIEEEQETLVDSAKVRKRYHEIAYEADIKDFFDFENMCFRSDLIFKNGEVMTQDGKILNTRNIRSITVKTKSGEGVGGPYEEKEIKLEMYDSLAANRDLGKHVGFFEKDNSANIPIVFETDASEGRGIDLQKELDKIRH